MPIETGIGHQRWESDRRTAYFASNMQTSGMRFELLPALLAHYAGTLLGVLTGLKLVAAFLIKDIKQLGSPTGRKQVMYGSRASTTPVAYEGEGSIEEVKANIIAAAGSVKQKVASVAAKTSESASATVKSMSQSTKKTTSKLEGTVDPKVLPSLSNHKAGSQAKTKIPAPTEAAPLGPGAVVPPKGYKPHTGESVSAKELDAELNKAPLQPINMSKKSKPSHKQNGDHHQPSSAPVTNLTQADGDSHEGASNEDDAMGDEADAKDSTGSLVTMSSGISEASSGGDSRPKRGRKVLGKLKRVFKG